MGETLDARRVPTPHDNVLQDIADDFVLHCSGGKVKLRRYVRIVPPDEFTASDRWDVQRFWSDDELVDLGAREDAIERILFLDSAETLILELVADLKTVKKEIEVLSEGPAVEVSLSDKNLFRIRRGTRVTRANGDHNPGSVPVYSGRKDPRSPLCSVSEKWARTTRIPIESGPIVTVNANGYVGATFVRKEKCIIHDDVMVVEVKDPNIDLEYLRQKLQAAIAEGNYEYEAKLYSRLQELAVEVPSCAEGKGFDLKRQQNIADGLKKFDSLKASLSDLGNWARKARIRD